MPHDFAEVGLGDTHQRDADPVLSALALEYGKQCRDAQDNKASSDGDCACAHLQGNAAEG